MLQLREVKKTRPKVKDVQIRIHATTAHIGDTKIRSLRPGLGPIKDFFFKPLMRIMLGFTGPRYSILGMDLAGEIVDLGKDVGKFKKGDQVFASAFYDFRARPLLQAVLESGRLRLAMICTHEKIATPILPKELTPAWQNCNTPEDIGRLQRQ